MSEILTNTFNKINKMSDLSSYTIEFKYDDFNNDLIFADHTNIIPNYNAYNMLGDILNYGEAQYDHKLKTQNKKEKKPNMNIKKVIFNNPATIIFWEDGDKTVVKVAEGDEYNEYYGFCCAVAKRLFGNNTKIKKLLKKFEAYDNKNIK